MGDGSGDGLFFSRARGVSEKLPARRRGLCQRGCWSLSLRSGSRVLLSERTGWNVDSNGRRKTLSSLARPRLDCCTRSQIRVGAFRARTGPRGKFEMAVTLEDLNPNACSRRESARLLANGWSKCELGLPLPAKGSPALEMAVSFLAMRGSAVGQGWFALCSR